MSLLLLHCCGKRDQKNGCQRREATECLAKGTRFSSFFFSSKILKKKSSYVVILPFFLICSYATAYAIGSNLREYRKLNKVSVLHFLLLSLVAGISGTSQVVFF